MKITIVGLGLIGGSLAKHIKKHTDHTVFGLDTNKETIAMALSQGAIDRAVTDVSDSDVTFVCLYPKQTVEFIETHKTEFKKASVVCDVCGVKRYITDRTDKLLSDLGVYFVGTHPMAGREFSGFEYSTDNLFDTASFIITPTERSFEKAVNLVEDLAYSMGFEKIVRSTPDEHDEIIAFTSQLAHIVSSAYIKSPAHTRERGFSAGSYLDLTRVAKLNEDMWTPLFLANAPALSAEIGEIISHLNEYKTAIDTADSKSLHSLLKRGRELKEENK
jgi:prephenate dehydrogenase